MKFHPYSEVFPLLAGDEMQALVDDIKERGLRQSIISYKGQILDGRNRFLACAAAKVPPKYKKFEGDDDAALALVVSANVQRRHLTEAQRAMAAAQIATLKVGANQHASRDAGTEGASRDAPSQSEAAEQLGVSRSSVQRAAKVQAQGSKALQRAVVSGEVPLKTAAAVVDLPRSEQLAAATEPKKPAKKSRKTPRKKPTEPEVDERGQPDDEEAESLARAEREYADSIDKIMGADDKLASAHTEIKRQAAEIATLKVSRDGYLNGKAAIEKLLRKEQSKNAQLSKQLDRAKADIDKLRERIAIIEE